LVGGCQALRQKVGDGIATCDSQGEEGETDGGPGCQQSLEDPPKDGS
jgi:hypothetical protein